MHNSPPLIGDQRLHTGFLQAAAKFPNHVAIHLGRRTLIYAEVEERARRWAALLLDVTGGKPKRVGVFGYRSETSYVGILASLLAGAMYVPLSPKNPPSRTRLMAEQADLDAIFVDEAALPQLAPVFGGRSKVPTILSPVVKVNAIPPLSTCIVGPRELEQANPLVKIPEVSRDDLAYLMYTSGSTGEPNGVPITHASVVHFMTINQDRYGITPEDRLTQFFDPTFDLSVFDLFMAWWNGAAICPPESLELLSPSIFVAERGISVWFSVPSLASRLLNQRFLKPGGLPSLRWSLFCGEALPLETAKAWQTIAPNSTVENLYGPTELTIACSAYRWGRSDGNEECINGILPIGDFYPGLNPIIVDEGGIPVPAESAGELCVAGPQTFSGYWLKPDLNAARFLVRADSDSTIRSYYRTGDVVRRIKNDKYVYLGRVDRQIKIDGYRVELGEIAAVLRQQPGVFEAVALGWPVERGVTHGIVAFVAGEELDPNALHEAVQELLPAYMVPRSIHVLPELPLNMRGKTDLSALLALLLHPQ